MLRVLALLLLLLGVVLGAGGFAFPGIDVLAALCFAGSAALAVVSAASGEGLLWGILAGSLAVLALVLHLGIVLGALGG